MSWLFGGGSASTNKPNPTVQRPPAPTAPTARPGGAQQPSFGGTPTKAPAQQNVTGSSGGFFNLPNEQRVGAGGAAPSSTAAPAVGGANLFGGLNLGAKSEAPVPAASPIDSSLFGGLSIPTTSAPVAAAPAVTGFNFMGAAAPAPSEDTSANTPSATSFSFLASGGAQTAAAPPASGFAFTKPASGGSSSSLPVSGLHTTGMGGLGGSGGAAAAPLAGPAALGADLATGGIKKKKPGFRPGFARAEDGAAPGGSVLSGLTVHEDVANTSVDGGAAGGDGGSGGLLAGMRLHAASDATEDSTANDLRRGSVSSVNNHGSSSGSVLAGLQVHSASAAAAAAAGETGSVSSGNTPIKTTAGVVGGGSTPGVTGFSFVAGGPAAAPEAGDNEAGSSSESIFGGLLRKTGSASSLPSSSAIGTEGAPSVGAGMGAIGSNVGSAFPPSFNASSSTAAVGAAAFTSPTASASSKSSGGNRGTSPTARMRATLTDLNDAARRTRMRLADLKIRLRGLVDQDRKASAEVDKLQLKVSEIESKQDEAIKNEQFEEAEALNESLDSVKGSLAAAEGRRKVISDEKQRVEAEQAQVFSESLAVTSMTVVGLKQYNEDRVNKLTSFRKEANSRHSVVIERVHDQEEQLRLKEEHVARDIKTVDDEEKQVERIITEQTEELSKQVTELSERHTRLAQEVIDLERLLEAKRREEKQAATMLDDAETRIRAIRGKFEKQVKRLQVKKADVTAEKAECTSEAASITKAKRDFAVSKKRDRHTEKNFMRQLSHNASELSTAESLRAALLEQENRRSSLAEQAKSAASSVRHAREGVESAMKRIRATQTRKAQLEAQASAATKSIESIDSKIPALNEEKKVAVAGKKFKEAGRINDELKRLSDAREAASAELSEATSGVDAAEEEAHKLESELGKLRAAAGEKEKEADLQRVELLRDAVRALTITARQLGKPRRKAAVAPTIVEVDPITLKPIPPSSSASAASTTEDGDHGGLVIIDESDDALGIEIDPSTDQSFCQTASVELLTAERDLLQEELNTLAAKHGVSSDIGPLPALESDGNAEGEAAAAAEHDTSAAADAAAAADEATATNAAAGAEADASSPSVAGTGEPQSDAGADNVDGDDAGAAPVEGNGGTDAGVSAADGGLLAMLSAAQAAVPVVSTGFGFLTGAGPSAAANDDALLLSGASDSAVSADAGEATPLDFALPTATDVDAITGSPIAVSNDIAIGDADDIATSPSAAGADAVVAAVEDDGAAAEKAAAEAAAAAAAVEAAARAARINELASIAASVAGIRDGIKEKEGAIENAVASEDYDTADAAQADIDGMLAHRDRLFNRAAELGVSSEAELESYLGASVDVNDASAVPAVAAAPATAGTATASLFESLSSSAGDAAAGFGSSSSPLSIGAVTTPDVDASGVPVASSLSFLTGSPIDSSSVPAVSALPFVSGFGGLSFVAGAVAEPVVSTSDECAPAADVPAVTGFGFLSQ